MAHGPDEAHSQLISVLRATGSLLHPSLGLPLPMYYFSLLPSSFFLVPASCMKEPSQASLPSTDPAPHFSRKGREGKQKKVLMQEKEQSLDLIAPLRPAKLYFKHKISSFF